MGKNKEERKKRKMPVERGEKSSERKEIKEEGQCFI